MTGRSSQDLRVEYAVVPGGIGDIAENVQCSAGSQDFHSGVGSVVVPATAITFEIRIPTIDDVDEDGPEGDETLCLDIFNPIPVSGAGILTADGSSRLKGTIINDVNDGFNRSLEVSAGDMEFAEADRGSVVEFNQKGGECGTADVNNMHSYQIDLVAQAAKADKDFVAQSVMLTMAGTHAQTNFPIEIINDLINESDEDLLVRVAAMEPNDMVAREENPVMIMDDDPGPLYSLSDVTASEIT